MEKSSQTPLKNSGSGESLYQLADRLVGSIAELVKTIKTEEELRIGFEKLLEPITASIGVKSEPKYERLSAEAKKIYRGRPDAVHGQMIIEYEAPGSFASESAVNHALAQLAGYMTAEANASQGDPIALVNRLVGVGFDGYSIFFVRYSRTTNGKAKAVNEKDFMLHGSFDFNPESARTFLTYLRALVRLPLTAEHLADKFGPKSKVAQLTVAAFVDALEYWKNLRVDIFFNEWKRLFGIVYGEQFSSQPDGEAKILAQNYGVKLEVDFQKLLFSVHTYFALLMKLIAAELITFRDSSYQSSYCAQFVHTSKDELIDQLKDIEEGGIYAKRGVTNFLEGDFFRWYLDAFSPGLIESIRELARTLSEFEPATTSIDPEATRDLLKKLYQYLVPQEVRHKLGEYYTPDWLAELVLNEVGYDGNTLKRVLDPACGSGTFIVLAIQQAKAFASKHKEPPLETAKRIKANIWGFDLNPLAVIAARTNYLFALGDLVDQLAQLEIPIYLADSVLWPEKASQMQLNFAGGQNIKIQTSVGEFHVPYIWVKDQSFLMQRAVPLIDQMTKQNYTATEALDRFRSEGLVFPPHEKVVENFYHEILELEQQGKNGTWARFLKNAFAPISANKFDFVVGNPPWIRWGYLSKEYREATLSMWKEYGLFSLKGHAARLGGGEKDFSMLFTYVAADYYLKKDATLGFLITQEVFKSKGAGEGFRKFRLGDGEYLKVIKAHDLVSVQPFEGAANKTAAIVLKKGHKTTYPVQYTVWTKKQGIGKIPTNFGLKKAMPLLQKKKLVAHPMGSIVGSWQTLEKSQKMLNVIQGKNAYYAHLGARVEPYGVFWMQIEQVMFNGDLIVRNLPEKGKQKIEQVKERVEAGLVFPIVRGSDIKRWKTTPEIYALISQDSTDRKGYPETKMKSDWPRSFGYLVRFKQRLLNRAAFKKYHAESGNPFYSQYNIADYTFARYKVVWKRMATDIIAAVISQHKTPFGYKTIIPTDTTSLYATDSELEAHYLCAIMNSTPVREFIKSYSSAGRGFGTPSVMKHVGIPKFDSTNEIHQKLAQLSKTLHDLKLADKIDQIGSLEIEVDRCVNDLFGITAS